MTAPGRALLMLGVFLVSAALCDRTYAQIDTVDTPNSIQIALDPASPAPGQKVHLSVQSSLFDLSNATVVWTSNGKTLATGYGVTSADVIAPAVGQRTAIAVSVTKDGSTASASATIIPATVNIIYESNSYIPPFFKGRALPSNSSELRLQAIPRFINKDGSIVSPDNIIFTWSNNGEVQPSLSGKGKSTALIDLPLFFGTQIISVNAHSLDNTFSGSGSITVTAAEPQLLLYTDHPLFGIMFHNALTAETFIPESEMTFAAIPLYAQSSALNDPALQYTWTLNQDAVATDMVKPNEITVDAGKTAGTAFLQLQLTSTNNAIMSASKAWSISFSSALNSSDVIGGTAKNPFNSSQ